MAALLKSVDVTQVSNFGVLVCVTQGVRSSGDSIVLATEGSVCRFVIALRRRRGWSQSRLAAAVGRSQQWVSAFERGRTDVSLDDALAVLCALGGSVAVRECAREVECESVREVADPQRSARAGG